MPTSSSIELLAPAGDCTCLRAAIENGADAVYFGLDRGFNARQRAENFGLANLAEVMDLLRQRNVKGYVTLNTLVFPNELADFEQLVRGVAQAGVDAVLVQDLGAARLIRQLCPDLPIHASTQMTLTSAECINVAASLQIERVVLPRELSIAEIRAVTEQSSIPVEVFIHGALCVAYSGQCLTSESLGGRSANRGQCAQACRLPYELYCDDQHVDLGRQQYLLSPQDLAGYDLIPELISAGVAALKIEGRLKSPEYVASITSHYRRAIDHALAGRPQRLTHDASNEMQKTFSRGFAPGWLEGCDHKRLVPATNSAKRGLQVGTVAEVGRRRVRVRLEGQLKAGDGVMFDADLPQNQQPGGRVFEIWRDGARVSGAVERGTVELAFRDDADWLDQVAPGQTVWITDDPQLTRRLRKSFASEYPRRRVPIDMHVVARVGQPLHVSATLPGGDTVACHSESALELARQHAATPDLFREQLARLGHTPLELAELTWEIEGRPMVPLSVLGQVRRELTRCILQRLRRVPQYALAAASVLPLREFDVSRKSGPTQLHILCRRLEQIELAIAAGVAQITADFADIRQYRQAVQLAEEKNVRLALATPRIHKPGEAGIFHAMSRVRPHAVLARNLAAIDYFRQQAIPVLADYSLNVANPWTAEYLMQLGVERVTASYDLNRDQLSDLVEAVPASWLEVVVHQHMPMFHMEHCVFCAVLSPGTNKSNCGRPCDRHVVQLADRVGMKHPLLADVGCRNTLYNAQPQSAAEIVPHLVAAEVNMLRIELLEQTPDDTARKTVELYQQLLRGEVGGKQVLMRLSAVNRVGVTRGSLEARRDPLAIL